MYIYLLLTATHSLRSSPSGSDTASLRLPLPSVAAACFIRSYWWEPSGIFFLGLKVLVLRLLLLQHMNVKTILKQLNLATTQILIMWINDSHSLLWPLRDRQCMSIMLNVGQSKHCGSIVISAVAVLTVNNIRQHHPWDSDWWTFSPLHNTCWNGWNF